MFAPRYFGSRFFARRYWAKGGDLPVVLDVQAAIPARRAARDRAQSTARHPNISTAQRRTRDGT